VQQTDNFLFSFLTRFLHRRCWPIPAQGWALQPWD